MSNIKDGGHAFPTQSWEYDGQGNVLQYQVSGITLRDYFAAKALPAIYKDYCENGVGDNWQTHVAEDAYKIADAMLAQREK